MLRAPFENRARALRLDREAYGPREKRTAAASAVKCTPAPGAR